MFKIIVAVCLLLIFGFANATGSSSSHSKPNILVILVDDLGYGDLSCNGGTDIYTPNIDKLFKEGLKFNNFYANCTVCSPTRASLLTGCYPDKVGVPGVIRTHATNSWGYLAENAITLPEVLQAAGYKTAIIGKWHLGLESPNTPNERGFDYFHGFLGDMMDDYWTHLRHGNNYMRENSMEINPEGHATDIFSQWTVDYLNENSKSKEPFFLYLAYNAPHFPIQPPENWLEKVQKRESGISEKRAKNVAFVEHLDFGIGKVMDAVKKNNLDKNTLIIFSSDNGGHLPSGASNGSLRGGKQDMYEGGIKVPTCFVWNGKIKSGRSTENPGITMDIFPSLCEIAGVNINHEVDGISLLRTLQGKDQITDNRTVFFLRREGGFYGGLAYYAALQGQYKLVQNTPFEPFQLFNLKTDPGEQIPLDANAEKLKDLKYKLSQHIRAAGKIKWQK